jgi:cell division transport system permease protein
MEESNFKTKLKRVIRAGFFNFWRSGYVSFASIMVMIFTLSVIGSVIFIGAILGVTMQEFRDKVDVNVYFLTTATEEQIFSLKTRIEALPEVEKVEYVSREESLDRFRKRHENDEVTLQALQELEENPLGAILNIKAKEPSQYEALANFLNEENSLKNPNERIIDKINYFENKVMIDRLSRIIGAVSKLGSIVSVVLVVISIMITLNTVRLAIYISKEEISVMQLVGASKNYVRGPFVVTGVLVGLISSFITILIFFPILYFLGDLTEDFFIGLNVYSYFKANFFEIAFIIIGSGVGIGALSSLLAVRKYLKL